MTMRWMPIILTLRTLQSLPAPSAKPPRFKQNLSLLPLPSGSMIQPKNLEDIFSPELNLENYKRDLVGAVAFNCANSFLYIIERLADEYKPVIHVWQVGER